MENWYWEDQITNDTVEDTASAFGDGLEVASIAIFLIRRKLRKSRMEKKRMDSADAESKH